MLNKLHSNLEIVRDSDMKCEGGRLTNVECLATAYNLRLGLWIPDRQTKPQHQPDQHLLKPA